VTSFVTYVQLAVLLIVYVKIQKLHTTCWGGWDFSEITWARTKAYSELYFPAALASASDFWRTGVIGAVAAKLGEEEVAVFNTSYRIMWIALILVGALSGASAINMSIRLGGMDPKGAKQAGYVGVTMATAMLVILSISILFDSRFFGMIFTNDEVFLDMFEEARVPFTLTLFFMNLAVVLERIPYSMGRTKEVFYMGFIGSWAGELLICMLSKCLSFYVCNCC
jgi:MATE family multidrug resistance protein